MIRVEKLTKRIRDFDSPPRINHAPCISHRPPVLARPFRIDRVDFPFSKAKGGGDGIGCTKAGKDAA